MSSGTPTSILGLHTYKSTDDLDYSEINADNKLVDLLPPTVCTSTTRPSTNLYQGRLIWEKDTGLLSMWDDTSSKWMPFGNTTPWITFTPKLYTGAGASTVAGTGATGKYQITGKVVTAWADAVFNAVTASGAAIDLPLVAKDRVLNCGTCGLFGASTPADQSGIAYMAGTKDKIVVVAYTQGFRDASVGHSIRYNVTYELP